MAAVGALATLSIPLPANLNKQMREELAKFLVGSAEAIRKGNISLDPDLSIDWFWVKPVPIQ